MASSLLVESWTWYAFVVLFIVFRYASRFYHVHSIKNFSAEDWIMLVVLAVYTCLIAFMNIVASLNTNLIAPEDMANLTPESVTSRIYGSKLVVVVEQCMITAQWGCKICLLLMYNKLTFGLKQQRAVKIVGGYVVFTWLLMEILYLGVWCRPISQYWAVPVDNIQCSAAINHLIVNAVFNITSDIMMLCIPLPMLITSKLPVLKKALLCVLFSMGIFVILCATLNKYSSFHDPFSPDWTFWYIREASVATLIANIPNCWPLMRRIFKLKSFSERSGGTGGATTGVNLGSVSAGTNRGVFSRNRSANDALSAVRNVRKDKIGMNSTSTWHGRSAGRLTKTESEENIYAVAGGRPSSAAGSGVSGNASVATTPLPTLEIWQNTEITVEEQKGNWDKTDRVRVYDGIGGGDEDQGYTTRTVVTAKPLRDKRIGE